VSGNCNTGSLDASK
jgi:hypothetical protein